MAAVSLSLVLWPTRSCPCGLLLLWPQGGWGPLRQPGCDPYPGTGSLRMAQSLPPKAPPAFSAVGSVESLALLSPPPGPPTTLCPGWTPLWAEDMGDAAEESFAGEQIWVHPWPCWVLQLDLRQHHFLLSICFPFCIRGNPPGSHRELKGSHE